MPADVRQKYQELQRQLGQPGGNRRGSSSLPAYWTVDVDAKRETEASYILTSGDPQYIETCSNHPFPFLAKPFRLTSLDELIARTLRKPRIDRSG